MYAKVVSIPHDGSHTGKSKTCPSIVSFSDNAILVGHEAYKAMPFNPTNCISSVKRLIGREFTDEEVQKELPFLPYSVVPVERRLGGRERKEAHVQVHSSSAKQSKTLSPEEVSSLVLVHLKSVVEEYLHEEVTEAVITVPAYFNDFQRKATRKAAELAHLNVAKMITEPTAAAFAYGLQMSGSKHVLVFDLGGGTFDVTLLHMEDGGGFNVLGTNGCSHLGGDDIDHVMVSAIASRVPAGEAAVMADKRALVLLTAACRSAKCELSEKDTTAVYVPKLVDGKDFTTTLSRAELETLMKPLLESCFPPLEQLFSDVNLDVTAVDEVVLVGGSTRIPLLRTMLKTFFRTDSLCTSINADEAVAKGAAIQAALLDGVDSAQLREMLMIDVTPISIGLMDGDGRMNVLIPRNARLPVAVTRTFLTAEDNQPAVSVFAYEGESEDAKMNTFLSSFDFPVTNYRGAKAGEREVAVTFALNEEGLLRIKAETVGQTPTSFVSSRTVLALYLAALVALYLVLKLAVTFDDESAAGPSSLRE